ncbi:MAG: BON domain-containing protein [Verrucomicrobiota bacterium]
MKTSILLPLLLAGLALAGCNSAMRSDSSTDTAAVSSPTISETPAQAETSASSASTSSPTSSTESTYNQPLQSPSASTSANNTDTTSYGATFTPATTNSDPSAQATPGATYNSLGQTATTPTSTPDASSTSSTTASSAYGTTGTTGSTTATTPSADVSVGAPISSPASTASTSTAAPSDNSSYTAPSDQLAVTATPSPLPPTSSTETFSTPVPASTTSSTSTTLASDISSRISEWRLNSTDIQSDLDRGATIVRTKDSIVGAPTGASDDDVVETMVKGKLQADSDVSSAKIDVDASNGEVMLKGTASKSDAIGRAIALALDTQGVTKVSSDIKVSMSEPTTQPEPNQNSDTPAPQN